MEHARAALAHKRKHANFSFNRHRQLTSPRKPEDSTYVCSRPLMIDDVSGDGSGE